MKDCTKPLFSVRRGNGHLLLMLLDIPLLALSYLIAGFLRFELDLFPALFLHPFSRALQLFLLWICFEGILLLTNSHNVIWRYAGYREYFHFALASFCSGFGMWLALLLIPAVDSIPVAVVCSGILLTFLFTGGVRLLLRFLRVKQLSHEERTRPSLGGRIMLIGAGSAGYTLIRDLSRRELVSEDKIVCIIDDDKQKQGKFFCGIPVVGGREDIEAAAQTYRVDTILFAIASISDTDRKEMINFCMKTKCALKTVPSLSRLIDGNLTVDQIRHVELEDLLERHPIRLSDEGIEDCLRGKTVLVTGVGSIGSELCRQIARYEPAHLILFDIYENNAYEVQTELKRLYPSLQLSALIGSVRDEARVDSLFAQYRPQVVYHAAAHKHVPLMENSPHEAIKNNVFGTLHVARAADRYGAERFVLISTDKAVNPTNIMGASKRLCEMVIQTLSRTSKTRFAAVRFGNVLGSNGSVIPLFRRQIESGGPVTITHPDIIRYFMTIPEAVSLILDASSKANGGEIFVLDMGKPVRILDMAEKLIRLSGYRPYEDIAISFVGLRPGEKLYEELLLREEGLEKTENDLIYVGKPLDFDPELFFNGLDELAAMLEEETKDLRTHLKRMVPTYREPARESECG